MPKRWVYLTETAVQDLTEELGFTPEPEALVARFGRMGAWHVQAHATGLPFRPGFVIPTEVPVEYPDTSVLPTEFWLEVESGVRHCERATGQTFGGTPDPLLLVLYAGSRNSMPGLLGEFWYVGLTDQTCAALVELSSDPTWVYQIYTQLIVTYAAVVQGVNPKHFHEGVTEWGEDDLSGEDWRRLAAAYLDLYREHVGEPFPQDPYRQLESVIRATLELWGRDDLIAYREANAIPHDWGMSVAVIFDVYGRYGPESGRGFAYTRHPITGERELYGEYLSQVGSDALIEGWGGPGSLEPLRAQYPHLYDQLLAVAEEVETRYTDMQALSFTVDRGRLWLWYTGAGNRGAYGTVRIALDLVQEGVISRTEAMRRMDVVHTVPHLRPVLNLEAADRARAVGRLLAQGVGAAAGGAVGAVVFDAETAVRYNEEGRAYIWMRETTQSRGGDDVSGLVLSQGVVTRLGGPVAEIASFCRWCNVPVIVGVLALEIDVAARSARLGHQFLYEGDVISIDGITGEIFSGPVPLVASPILPELVTFLSETNAYEAEAAC